MGTVSMLSFRRTANGIRTPQNQVNVTTNYSVPRGERELEKSVYITYSKLLFPARAKRVHYEKPVIRKAQQAEVNCQRGHPVPTKIHFRWQRPASLVFRKYSYQGCRARPHIAMFSLIRTPASVLKTFISQRHRAFHSVPAFSKL